MTRLLGRGRVQEEVRARLQVVIEERAERPRHDNEANFEPLYIYANELKQGDWVLVDIQGEMQPREVYAVRPYTKQYEVIFRGGMKFLVPPSRTFQCCKPPKVEKKTRRKAKNLKPGDVAFVNVSNQEQELRVVEVERLLKRDPGLARIRVHYKSGYYESTYNYFEDEFVTVKPR